MNKLPQLRSSPQSDVFKRSIKQLGEELSNFFYDKDYVPSYLLKSTDDLSDIGKFRNTKNFAIPLWTYRMDSMSGNKDRLNRGSLKRYGIVLNKTPIKRDIDLNIVRPDDPNKIYKSLHLSPVDITFDISYFCSADDMYEFGPLWQQAAQSNYLNFQLEIGTEQYLDIRCELSEDVTFSGIDLDSVQYTQFVTSIVMTTYHGVITDTKPVNSFNVNIGTVDKDTRSVIPSEKITRAKDMTVFIGKPEG